MQLLQAWLDTACSMALLLQSGCTDLLVKG
jgi:hypothetical protein